MQVVRLCVWLGSALLGCYAIYFGIFAYQMVTQVKMYTKMSKHYDDQATYYRPETVFELKHQEAKSSGKDFYIEMKNITNLQTYRAFNPAIQFYRNQIYFIVRLNYLFKDENPNYKNGKPEWRKNNKLIAGKLRKVFDNENQLIKLEFEKFSDLEPFGRASFDCEMTPDYIDGGHGLQDARLFIIGREVQMVFNAREQHSSPFEECQIQPNRGIFWTKLKIERDTIESVIPSRMLRSPQDPSGFSTSRKVERNWIPLQNEKFNLLVYSIYPNFKIYRKVTHSSQLETHQEINTTMSFDNIFANIAYKADLSIKNAKNAIELHGSSPIIRVNDYYLGILHCHYSPVDSERKIYLNYFFKMDILTNRVTNSATRPLPLTTEIDDRFKKLNRDKWYYAANYPTEHEIAFVSDMTIDKDILMIAYGAGDAEARVFVLGVTEIENYFNN